MPRKAVNARSRGLTSQAFLQQDLVSKFWVWSYSNQGKSDWIELKLLTFFGGVWWVHYVTCNLKGELQVWFLSKIHDGRWDAGTVLCQERKGPSKETATVHRFVGHVASVGSPAAEVLTVLKSVLYLFSLIGNWETSLHSQLLTLNDRRNKHISTVELDEHGEKPRPWIFRPMQTSPGHWNRGTWRESESIWKTSFDRHSTQLNFQLCLNPLKES